MMTTARDEEILRRKSINSKEFVKDSSVFGLDHRSSSSTKKF